MRKYTVEEVKKIWSEYHTLKRLIEEHWLNRVDFTTGYIETWSLQGTNIFLYFEENPSDDDANVCLDIIPISEFKCIKDES